MHTRSSPTGPAEQDEGGSLYSRQHRHLLTNTRPPENDPIVRSKARGSVDRAHRRPPLTTRPTCIGRLRQTLQAPGDKTSVVHDLPAEISEFLVNALESHFVCRCWVSGGVVREVIASAEEEESAVGWSRRALERRGEGGERGRVKGRTLSRNLFVEKSNQMDRVRKGREICFGCKVGRVQSRLKSGGGICGGRSAVVLGRSIMEEGGEGQQREVRESACRVWPVHCRQIVAARKVRFFFFFPSSLFQAPPVSPPWLEQTKRCQHRHSVHHTTSHPPDRNCWGVHAH